MKGCKDRATALVLGGGPWQVPIIEAATRSGLRVLVADIAAEAPGRNGADTFIQMDTNDRNGLLRVAMEHHVDLVLADQSDRVVPVAAFLNEALGLLGIRPETARRFTDKYEMRRCLEGSGIPMPAYSEVSDPGGAKEFGGRWGYPVVLKPKARQASLGVFKVNDERQLLEAFPATLQESTDGKILIEEFIDGIEVTVEAFSLAGECRALAVSEKTHYDFNPCIASRLAYPPRMAECTILAIKRTAESVVQRLGLKDGISHAEYRVRAGVPYLVEVGARGGGNSIASTIIPHVSGVDVYELLIRRLQGLDAQFPQIENRSALLQFFDFQPGRVKAVEGLDVVRRDKLAQEIELYFGPGDVLAEASSDRSRPGYFIVLGDTRDETDEAARRVLELVKVGYE